MSILKNQDLSKGEEIANSITHGIGALLSIAALTLLIGTSLSHGSSADIVGAMIFGISMLLLYLMSTFCHAFARKGGTVRKVFRILDHSAIYLLIAGTYTPFCLTMIGGTQGITILTIQWVLAFIGILFRSLFYNRFIAVHVAIYLIMGWMIAFFIPIIYPLVSPIGLVLLAIGGLFYTIGVLFYAIRMFKFHHMVWHLCVLGGTACHFFMIYLYVLPR
ncbi:MAG: hemolysin III family protein [Clostridiales bacterium]|nr:hemolysin III family protein [Clostridiales bacterium]